MPEDRIISEQAFAEKRLMQQRIKLVVVLLLVVGLVGFLCLVLIPRSTADRFRSQVERDLPIGTERSKVEAWLKARQLSFSNIGRVEDDRIVGLGGEFHKNYIDILGEEIIRFDFHFDKNDRLTEFSVREFHLFV